MKTMHIAKAAKRKGRVLLAVMAMAGPCLGSAPVKPLKKVSGPDLKITIEGPQFLQAVGWRRGKKVAPKKEIILKRAGLNQLPTEILLVPADKKKKPLVLDVKEKRTLRLSKKETNFPDIPSHMVVLWAETPPGLCYGHSPQKGAPSQLTVIRFPRPQVNTLRGFDTFTLQAGQGGEEENRALWLHLWTDHGHIKNLNAAGLEEATEQEKWRCLQHYGGKCDRVLRVKKAAFGQWIELNDIKLEKSDIPCPV